jgi:hypothetical protein
MIYEDLIVEHYSTLMIVITNIKWTSLSSNEFTILSIAYALTNKKFV